MRRDGSKVNVGRARLSNSSRLGPSKQQRPRRATRLWSVEKRSPVERRKDRGTIRGGVERAGGVCCGAKGAKRWGLAGATVALPLPPRGTPIGRMRAKVKLRQVVTPLLPSLLPRTVLPLSLSLSPSPSRAPFSARTRTPLPRGHVLPARDDLRLWGPRGIVIARLGAKCTPFLRSWLRTSFGGGFVGFVRGSYTI